jgi:hypothetical protein
MFGKVMKATELPTSPTDADTGPATTTGDSRSVVQILHEKTGKALSTIETTLIAPCGMNCRLCRAYVRTRKACPGCRGKDSLKSKSCVFCRIKNCANIAKPDVNYCFECDVFPCDKLKHLDKRYRTKYNMSMIDNLENIRKFGIRSFIRDEKGKWTCPKCGELISVHKPQCLSCGHKWR